MYFEIVLKLACERKICFSPHDWKLKMFQPMRTPLQFLKSHPKTARDYGYAKQGCADGIMIRVSVQENSEASLNSS